jgi:predicted CXXCH cytochrome family protein
VFPLRRSDGLAGWWVVGAAVAALGFVVSSCSTIERTLVVPPAIEGATFAGNRACYECHTNYVRHFPASPHARLHVPDAGMKGQAGCESCHGPGSRHIAAGGGRGRFIINPGKDPQACLTCHLQTHAEFRLPQRHPVLEGKLNCVQCHDPHGSDIMKAAGTGLAMARLNESCAQCHQEQARPHVYEHDAMRDGCTVCHVPHGSVNAKMLVERDLNLCLKCHAQVPGPGLPRGEIVIGSVNHTAFVSRGACWSAGCHSAIHGSNVSPNLHY